MLSRHRDLSDRCGNSIGRSPYRMTIAQDRSSDDLMRAHAALMPTITTEVLRREKEIQIICRNVFAPRPLLSQYIDMPEKAARLEAKMAAGFRGRKCDPHGIGARFSVSRTLSSCGRRGPLEIVAVFPAEVP
jgi:hypothetical protein